MHRVCLEEQETGIKEFISKSIMMDFPDFQTTRHSAQIKAKFKNLSNKIEILKLLQYPI